MSKDNVTPFSKPPKTCLTPLITLEMLVQEISDWRRNKKRNNEKMPETIWDHIFILLETQPQSKVLRAIGITHAQFHLARDARYQATKQTNEAKNNISFCEAKLYPLSSEKGTNPDLQASSTCLEESEQDINDNNDVVEFCEPKPDYPVAYTPAKAFATTTSVVELYRPDGMLMKIHICTDSFEELLRAFFKG